MFLNGGCAVSAASPQDATGHFADFDLFVDIMFIVDMCFNFFTGYSDGNGVYINTVSLIALKYLKTFFVIDFVSSVPIDRIAAAALGGSGDRLRSFKLIRILRLVRLLKLFRLLRLSRYMNKVHLTHWCCAPLLRSVA